MLMLRSYYKRDKQYNNNNNIYTDLICRCDRTRISYNVSCLTMLPVPQIFKKIGVLRKEEMSNTPFQSTAV